MDATTQYDEAVKECETLLVTEIYDPVNNSV